MTITPSMLSEDETVTTFGDAKDHLKCFQGASKGISSLPVGGA